MHHQEGLTALPHLYEPFFEKRNESGSGLIKRLQYVDLKKMVYVYIRWITKAEAERLCGELPEHIEAMVRFSLATGLRESNVTGLEWNQIDMQRKVAWIHPDQAKSKKAIGIPLNADAVQVIREQLGKHQPHVFRFKAKPVKKSGWSCLEEST